MKSKIETKNLHGLRAKRRFFLFFRHSFIWVLAGLVILWLSSFLFIPSVAQKKIHELTGGAVHIQSGRLTLSAGILLEGVVVAKDLASLDNEPILQADEIVIQFNPWQLLTGKLRLDSVRLANSLFLAQYNADQDLWNFQELAIQHSSGQQTLIPFIVIENGTVQLSRIVNEQTELMTTVGINGRITRESGKPTYNFKFEADGRFGFTGTVLEGSLSPAINQQKGQLSLQGQVLMPETVIFGNTWNLNDIKLDCEFAKQDITLNRCEFTTVRGQGDVRGNLHKTDSGDYELKLQVDLKGIKLSEHEEPDAVVYSEPVMELLDPRVQDVLTRYHPTGIGDITVSIQGYLDDLEATEVNGNIVCQDISILDSKFPYQIDHITGQMELTGRDLYLKDLTGKHNDVELTISGHVLNFGPDRQMDIRTTSPNMRFDDDLYNALNESVQLVWYSFLPSGTTGIDYHFKRFDDGRKDSTLKLDLKNAAMIYRQFPYPLEHLTGEIVIDPNDVEFHNLTAHYVDDRNVTLSGEVRDIRSKQPDFQIHVNAEQIPVDDLFVNALPVSQRALFDQLEIDAKADMEVDVLRNQTGERLLDFLAHVQIQGSTLVYEGFKIPMTDFNVDADITNENIKLNKFEGLTDGATVVMSGQLSPQGANPEKPHLCLDLDLRDFPLNDTFWTAVGPDANDLLGDFRMSGRVNASGHLAINSPDSQCALTDLKIQCLGNTLFWSDQELAQASGTFHWKDKTVRFELLSLQDIAIGSLPEEMFSERLHTLYSSLNPSGDLSINVHDGLMKVGDTGIQKMDVTGDLIVEKLTCGPDRTVQQLYGSSDLLLQADFEKKRYQVLTNFDIDHMFWDDYLISNINGQLVYDPNTMYLESEHFKADLYGGRVTGDLNVDLRDPKNAEYRLAVELSRANVKELLSAGFEQARQNVIDGLVSGTLSLSGNIGQLEKSSGKATVLVENIKLGKQSIMGKVLTAIQLRAPKEFIFHEVQAEAAVQGSQLTIETLRMIGDPLVFRGSGKLYLDRQEIEVDLVAYDQLVSQKDNIFDQLVRSIGSALWRVELRGDIKNPKIDTVFLSLIKQPVNNKNKGSNGS